MSTTPPLDPRTDSPTEPVPAHDGAPPRRWALVLAGPAVWIGHFLLVYLVAEAACAAGLAPLARWTAVAVTVVAVLLLLGTTAAAQRWGRGLRGAAPTTGITPGVDADPDGGGAFWDDLDDGPRDLPLAAIAVGLGWLFVAATAVVGAAAVVLPPC